MDQSVSHYDDGGEEGSASAHHEEAINKPGRPDDAIGNPCCLQSFLQA